MISICIPVYNVDVSNLASELSKQLQNSKFEGEVLILDDGSDKHYRQINSEVKKLPFVQYFEQTNKGRSKTRNQLARLANFQRIAFIDGDCQVNKQYINNYTKIDIKKFPVVIGGLEYGNRPADRKLLLRWNYGRKREVNIKYDENSISFLSSNFMIDSELFKSIWFNEEIKAYGHEDTMLGIQLRKRKIKFHQINNSVIHLGLEPAKVFLGKTQQSISNFIIISGIEHFETLQNHRINKAFNNQFSFAFNKTLSVFYDLFEKPIEFVLENIYPSIILFDIYKLLFIYKLKCKQ